MGVVLAFVSMTPSSGISAGKPPPLFTLCGFDLVVSDEEQQRIFSASEAFARESV
jgi:hypothetical protein